jgi:HEPN domain-containing protein
VSTSRDVAFRIALAEGFLAEAEQDFTLQRWRSCVDNAQLVVENSGKAALALFGIVPKTHDPAHQIASILREQTLPPNVSELLHVMLPDLLVLGAKTHFLTDYGDEASYTLPWDLFTQTTAEDALASARQLVQMARLLEEVIAVWRQEQHKAEQALSDDQQEDSA